MNPAPREQHFEIHIDREHIRVEKPSLSGAELRALVTPPIGPERDLYEEVPGPADDRLIADDDQVQIRNGLHFFSAPRTINPG